ncbi:MAG TPA: hypothetical protein EYO97_01105 [Gemmatimonadetes bacterium]|nr:hypothetical protein [Gemmatimonadota bacterium]HIC52405.1 hypothetical protein [Gemmatimonadota bacterium]
MGAERFLAEIKTTANLQHLHILPLFDSGEADGFLFYVMPRVEGLTLRQRLDRESTEAFHVLAILLKHALEEERGKMTELLTDDFVKTARRDPQFSYFVGSIFVLAGMNEQAMDWIENALDRGFFNYPFVAQQDPLLNNLRDTPQFNELLARMKTRWQAFVAATS